MKVIVGLGNPGMDYANTRHNIGFMLIDRLATSWGFHNWRDKFHAQIAEGYVGSEKVLLVKPQTFMNNSGESVGEIARFYKLEPEDIFVAHDDMDIPVGTLRIRKKGSHGGHNGIRSIINHLGTENFPRIRMGIGRPLPNWTVVNWVLANFNDEDKANIVKVLEALVPATEAMVQESVDIAMNKYNPKKQKQKKLKEPPTKEELGDRANIQKEAEHE